jgi:Bacteriocin-protection, YdeI or OmpD-Associated/Domain of unknown function (DUF1905)
MKPPSQRFQATIYKIWMMRHVDVPPEIADALIKQLENYKRTAASPTKRKAPKPKHIPVVAAVNHCSTRTTLVPAGVGRYRLQINTALRRAGGADSGDVIGVTLQLDTASREIPVPAELKSVLKQHPKVHKEFDRLPPGHRRQLLLYYLRAKSPKARAHVTERLLDHLHERALLQQPRRQPKPKPQPAAPRHK